MISITKQKTFQLKTEEVLWHIHLQTQHQCILIRIWSSQGNT